MREEHDGGWGFVLIWFLMLALGIAFWGMVIYLGFRLVAAIEGS